jgi:hypothetical protein
MIAPRSSRAPAFVRALVLFLALPAGAAALSSGCFLSDVFDECDDVACSPGADIRTDVARPVGAFAGAAITVCRNDECVLGNFPSDLAASGAASFPSAARGKAPQVIVFVGAAVGSGTRLAVSWDAVRDEDLRSGDVYRVTARDGAGTTLVSFEEKVAAYPTLRAAGPECERGRCKRIDIHRSGP